MSMEFQNRIGDQPLSADQRRQLAARRRQEAAPIRWDLVERVRAEIAAGVYETEEKLEIAIERMSHSLLA